MNSRDEIQAEVAAAKDARAAGRFEEAAVAFTLAAHGRLYECEYLRGSLDENATDVAFSLRYLLHATLCYRLGGSDERARVRARSGALVCDDLRQHLELEVPQGGILHEFEGDFRAVAGIDGVQDAYNAAREWYGQVGDDPTDHVRWQTEPEFELNLAFLFDVAGATEYDLDWRRKRALRSARLEERIEYKCEHLPAIVAELLAAGTWRD